MTRSHSATTTETVCPLNGKNFPYGIDTGTAPAFVIFTDGAVQKVTFQPRLTTDPSLIEKS